MLRTCVLLLLLLLGWDESALAERTIVCATSVDIPPMEFVDAEGNAAGYAIDLFRAVGRIAGFKAEFKTVKRDEIVAGLQSGQYDAICSSVLLDEEARKAMDISTPYHLARKVLVVNEATRIHSSTSMQGAIIGVPPGIGAGNLPGARITIYRNIAKAMEDLYVNRLDGVICDNTVAAYFASVTYQNRLKVTGYLGQGDRVSYAVAVKKGDKEVLDLLNRGISTVRARDIDKELRMKWFTR